MTTPIYDTSSSPTPHQRLERLLAHLPLSDSDETPPGGDGAVFDTSRGILVEPIQRINEVMRSYNVEFHLQEYGNRVVTRIIDRDSGDVIRQIPSEEVLRIAESLEQLRGRLIRHEA